jgi:hypothetical protein
MITDLKKLIDKLHFCLGQKWYRNRNQITGCIKGVINKLHFCLLLLCNVNKFQLDRAGCRPSSEQVSRRSGVSGGAGRPEQLGWDG